ncbi:Uncharacterised protein [Actinomyces bovis]|uniref:DUF4190 domain-containing protein n=1 Tax=Actinomyces bovis TaxID=1658 RepID=A0ABY1VNR7_9ACTO|nr:DUF4190 domain-containing protein [Actinomyces bovis]SPT53695.1 Uncharacterised protein [Actinomyces bovis]VEG55820.1 Uncharacterised protein [Actinomyces israelii]
MTTSPSAPAPQAMPAVEPFPGTEDLDPAVVFSGPGYTPPPLRTDPVCLIALVVTLFSAVPFVGLLAAGLGWWGLRRLRDTWATGETMAWAGVVVGLVSSVIWAWGLALVKL